MTAPRLEACHFDRPGAQEFARLARVLERTAAEHCPGWQRTIRVMPTPQRAGTGLHAHVANTAKLGLWVETIQRSADGDRLLLLDVDTCIVRPLDDIWDQPFDLAYATKRHGFPFNLGVLFVRASAPVRAFFARWRDENDRLFHGSFVSAWRAKYGGVNQASFGSLLEQGSLNGLSRLELSCREWNCEESAWHRFDPSVTRILHLKGELRRAVFNQSPASIDVSAAVDYWRRLDAQVSRHAQTA